MLLSMTGFGRSTGQYQDKLITVDLKSLNSKFMDLSFMDDAIAIPHV